MKTAIRDSLQKGGLILEHRKTESKEREGVGGYRMKAWKAMRRYSRWLFCWSWISSSSASMTTSSWLTCLMRTIHSRSVILPFLSWTFSTPPAAFSLTVSCSSNKDTYIAGIASERTNLQLFKFSALKNLQLMNFHRQQAIQTVGRPVWCSYTASR